MIYESLDQCSKILAEEFGVPFITFHSNGLHSIFPRNAAYQPIVFSTFNSVMSFSERMQNILFYAIQSFVSYKLETSFQQLRHAHNMDESKYIGDAFKKASLKFVLAHYAVDYSGMETPTTVLLGGYIEPPEQAMDTCLANILDRSIQGVVLFSLGSMVRAEHSNWIRFFADAFAQLPYTIIWQLNSENDHVEHQLHKNTFMFRWLPTTDVLAHPNTKAFITHCGRNSIHEAATYGVPTIAIPLHSEQHFQAQKLIIGVGMAIKLDIHTLTPTLLADSVVEVITKPVYKNNAERVSKVITLKHRPQSEKILYWVNYVVSTGGAPHLRSHGQTKLVWYQDKQLDVGAAFLALVIIMVFLIRYVCMLVLHGCFCVLHIILHIGVTVYNRETNS